MCITNHPNRRQSTARFDSNVSYIMNLRIPIKIQVTLLIALTLLGFYFNFFQWYLVSNDIYTFLLYLAVFLSFILGARVIYWQHKNNYNRLIYKKLDPANSLKDRIKFSAMIIFGFAMSLILALPFGLPVSLHVFSSTPSEIEITVESIHASTRRSIRCINIENYTFFNGHFCHLPKTLWRNVQEGDVLIAKGEQSIFGFYAHALVPANKSSNLTGARNAPSS